MTTYPTKCAECGRTVKCEADNWGIEHANDRESFALCWLCSILPVDTSSTRERLETIRQEVKAELSKEGVR